MQVGDTNEILVVWKADPQEYEQELEGRIPDDEGDQSDREEDVPDVPHTIVFKCIGTSRDSHSQLILQTVRNVIASGGMAPVRMRPEPTNVFDSKAIMFECEPIGNCPGCSCVLTL